MAWIRMCGGSKKPSFPWNALTDGTWNRTSITSSSSASMSMECLTLTPKLTSASRLTTNISCTTSNWVTHTIVVSTDGVSWNTISSAQTGTNINFNISLSSYVGQQLYIRVIWSNGTGGSQTSTITSCVVTG